MTFIVPHPDPIGPRERVENGLALLEFNGWSRAEIRANVIEDLNLFDMNDSCNCIVGRTVGWSSHDDVLIGFEQDELTSIESDEVFGFDGDSYRELADAWLDLLDINPQDQEGS